eukprot:COSAG01_NODE_15831_length_1295_cov_1.439799_2_plen_185_part_01
MHAWLLCTPAELTCDRGCQARKLRTALSAGDGHSRTAYRDLKVGSTELFQGQERHVVIISTVRSTQRFVEEHDRKHNIGFLVNPKRFNVAVTRAIALLIVVGDPRVLWHDPHWGELLRFCHERGAYVGCPLPSGSHGEAEVEQRQREMQPLLHNDDLSSSDAGSDDEHEAAPSQRMMQESLPFER